ncbi:MAG TPA: DNA polymerase III subunit alpha [Propionibacteriaceae bacterium]|nr:DNA polymerase III subunit alpha [Propionibacteriaceae bacterium]
MDTLALTDRDGMYGAVRFAKACLGTGVAPVIGVDFAMPFGPDHPDHPRHARAPRRTSAARGGEVRDLRLPRVVAMATSRRGWGQLSRLTTATHLAGDRGSPITTRDLVARHAEGGDLLVMLGADSEVGLAVARGRRDHAEAELRRWLDVVDPSHLVVAVTDHHLAGRGMGTAHQAGAMLALADHYHLTGVLTNHVRMAHRHQATTVDVLDAARRLVPLDVRNVDRRNAEGYLKPGKDMLEVAREVARYAGRGAQGAERLLGDTRTTAIRCRLDPQADIGLGEIHLPEFDVLGTTGDQAMAVLRQRCEAGVPDRYGRLTDEVARRLDDELDIIATLGFASYFLTVADVVGIIRGMGIRCAARGSGAGSLVNYLLGISGVDPLAYGLVMERVLSPLRLALPDIDLDVESARRPEIYTRVLEVFGGERVAAVAMIDTYRVRHAVRDVGAALSLPPAEIDAIAKAFPHIRARDARAALRDLPELRSAGLNERRLDLLFGLVESLDGLPRHLALHPCGVILSDTTLGDRTPIEASFGGIPMSQFDKDDVEDMGLLKLDVLGIRMQSSMAHALGEIERTTGSAPDIDALAPFDDPGVYDLIAHAATLGCFQIESPGQRELVGKFGPENFTDIIIDISLFRPGPVKSDMVIPFLNARQGWAAPRYLHPSLEPALAETGGVVVFHEQIIKIISIVTGCSYAEADEARRALGDPAGQLDVRQWLVPTARERGYPAEVVERIWQVLQSFASFGFCKAHAAAFALPTYQSAWLKRHYPAHFLAGILTHDPGMYPKRLLLEEARRMGVEILGVDVNASTGDYRVEPLGDPGDPGRAPRVGPGAALDSRGLPDASGWGIRLSLADIKGISEAEVVRIVAGQPYSSLSDFWARAHVEAPVVERLILAGGFDRLYGTGRSTPARRSDQITRRDLILALADMKRLAMVEARTASRARGLRRHAPAVATSDDPRDLARRQAVSSSVERRVAMAQSLFDDLPGDDPAGAGDDLAGAGWAGPPADVRPSGLPEFSESEQISAELEILGLDASRHIVEFYRDFLAELGTAEAASLLHRRNHSEVLIAGVKVATQTPPVRSGRRVVFLTLDDSTGPVDATFFEDVQGPYAATVFASWLLVVRGQVRRTGPRGVSVLATGAWDLAALHAVWRAELAATGDHRAAIAAVRRELDAVPVGVGIVGEPLSSGEPDHDDPSRPGHPAYADWVPGTRRGGAGYARGGEPGEGPVAGDEGEADTGHRTRAGGMGRRRVLVHASGFKQSPYADVRPSGSPASQAPPPSVVPGGPLTDPPSAEAPRKLWHSSPGSSGR